MFVFTLTGFLPWWIYISYVPINNMSKEHSISSVFIITPMGRTLISNSATILNSWQNHAPDSCIECTQWCLLIFRLICSYRVSNRPIIHPEFNQSLRELPKRYSPQFKPRFHKLIDKYGTHYITKVTQAQRVVLIRHFWFNHQKPRVTGIFVLHVMKSEI